MWLFKAIFIAPVVVAYWCVMYPIKAVIHSQKMLMVIRRWGQKDKGTHGDAAYTDDKTLKKLGHLENQGFLMGVTDKGKRVFTNPERSALIMAPPGSGKSQHYIAALRAVLERPAERLPFLIIGDADGELYRATSKLMSARGYNIMRLDAWEPNEWSKYDLLAELDTSFANRFRYDRSLDALCRLLVTDEPHSKQPHFVDFARILLKCVITVNVKYEGNNKPFGELIQELLDGDKRAALLQRSKKYGDEYVTAALDTMGKLADKPEGLSMMTTALRKLEPWNDAAVKELTYFGPDMHGQYKRGWSFNRFFSEEAPCALFVRTGIDNQAGGHFSRVIYGNAINAVAHIRNTTGQPLKRELELFIDEAGLTGYCPPIENAYSRQRKSGVRVRMAFLSMSEFKKTYPEAENMWSGSDAVVFGGGKDSALAKEVSELAGDYTIENKGRSQGDHGESRSMSEQARRLIKPDEIRSLGYEQELMLLDSLIVKGRKPWRKGKKGIEYL